MRRTGKVAGVLLLLSPTAIAIAATADEGGRATADVTLASNAFTPKNISIAPGDTVHWHATDGIHNVKLDDGSYLSGDPTSNLDASRTFPTAGTFAYYCQVHGGKNGAGMSGTVTVGTSGSTTVTPTATATATAGTTPGPYSGLTATPTASVTATPSVTPTPTSAPVRLSAKKLRVQRVVRHRRVRGSLQAKPGNARLIVVVKAGDTVVGQRRKLRSARRGRSAFAVRIDRAPPLRVTVTATVKVGGKKAATSKTVRLRAAS